MSCNNLETVTFSPSSTLEIIGNDAFKQSGILSITIPNTVTTIGRAAFMLCTYLTNITFYPTIVERSIELPSNLYLRDSPIYSTIEAESFRESGVTSIDIPNTYISIGDSAFLSCDNLESITFQQVPIMQTFGNDAFKFTPLTTIDLPDSLEIIGDRAFKSCTNLATVTISLNSSLEIIGSEAFMDTALTSIQIPALVNTIGTGAFRSSPISEVQVDNSNTTTSLGSDIFTDTASNKTILFYYTANYDELNVVWQPIATEFTANYNSAAACFNENTKILCLNLKTGEEKYIPVKNLNVGNLVKTYLHGYRKISLIKHGTLYNNPYKFTSCMYILKKTQKNRLIEDLIITGGHSLLVDKLTPEEQQNQLKYQGDPNSFKIDDKFLLLSAYSSLFKPIRDERKKFTWYHFCLESDNDNQRFGVFANGALVEIPSKNQLSVFT